MTYQKISQTYIQSLYSNTLIESFLKKRSLSVKDVAYLLEPVRTHQHNPHLLNGVKNWIDTLHSIKGKQIAIMPDYDADGILSGTVARVGLSLFGFGDSYLYTPRLSDGYGLTRKSVDDILEAQPDTEVLITTDNGSNAHVGIAYAKERGLMVFVTDHHLASLPTEADAEVNPNSVGGESYPFTQISGGAVIYKVLFAYGHTYIEDASIMAQYESLLLLVGISTISDVMPLIDENRYMVSKAVTMLKDFEAGHTKERMGLYDDSPIGQYYRGLDLLVMTLRNHQKLKYGIDSDTFGFMIGPMLNSPRRMSGESKLGFDLFQTKRADLIDSTKELPSDTLFNVNEERKKLIRGLTSKMFAHIESSDKQDPVEHAIFNATMGGGVAGLLAGIFTKEYGLPSIGFSIPLIEEGVVVFNGDISNSTTISGSARSPASFNIHAYLTEIDTTYPELIEGWGGHAQAAGISIKASNYERFKQIFTDGLKEVLAQNKQDAGTKPKLTFGGDFVITTKAYDALLSECKESVDLDSYTEISVRDMKSVLDSDELSEAVDFFGRLAPYGQGFAKPLFSVVVAIDDAKAFYMGAEKQHVKLTLDNGLSVIHWNGADVFRDPKTKSEDRLFIITGEIGVNEFMGNISLQLITKKIREI